MTPADAGVVEALYTAWNEGGAPAFADLLTPDAEWHEPSEVPGSSSHRGREAVMAYIESLVATIGRFSCEVQETATAGRRVLAAIRMHGSTSPSGIPVEIVVFHLHHVRGGHVAQIDAFLTREAGDAALHEGEDI